MRKRTNRICAFESLENRRVLAGTVTTSLQGNVLTISGDDAANSVAVFNSSPGVVQVLGLDGTTISGTTLYAGVTGINFNFNAGLAGVNKGNDVIVVTNLTLSAGLAIAAADGNIIVAIGQFDNTGGLVDSAVDTHLGSVSIGNGLGINLGNGTNTVVANDATVQGGVGLNFALVSGTGANTFTLENFSVAHAALFNDFGPLTLILDHFDAKNLTIASSIGNDSISLSNCTIAQKFILGSTFGNDIINLDHVTADSMNIALGPGIDQLTAETVNVTHAFNLDGGANGDTIEMTTVTAGTLTVFLSAGDDSFTLTSSAAGRITISGGEGTDSITLTGVNANQLTVGGGAGNDTCSLTTVTVNRLVRINGGLGADTVTLTSLSANRLNVVLGVGADDITLQNVTIAGAAAIGGGPGSDTYTDDGGNTFGTLNRKSFETVV